MTLGPDTSAPTPLPWCGSVDVDEMDRAAMQGRSCAAEEHFFAHYLIAATRTLLHDEMLNGDPTHGTTPRPVL